MYIHFSRILLRMIQTYCIYFFVCIVELCDNLLMLKYSTHTWTVIDRSMLFWLVMNFLETFMTVVPARAHCWTCWKNVYCWDDFQGVCTGHLCTVQMFSNFTGDIVWSKCTDWDTFKLPLQNLLKTVVSIWKSRTCWISIRVIMCVRCCKCFALLWLSFY